ncbi:sugar transport protein 2 [Spinacia oleracea]|uniref:Sugar transport protein 2 n=1 Tax=Spinacia oleracea TaxID=3562 RepID=A0ABM3R7V7_SPIOL|nr:sugar transport protein 2-like [Spinacia oleracea]
MNNTTTSEEGRLDITESQEIVDVNIITPEGSAAEETNDSTIIRHEEERPASQEIINEYIITQNEEGPAYPQESHGALNVENPPQASTQRRSAQRSHDKLLCMAICLLGGFSISYLNATIGNVIDMDGLLKRLSKDLFYRKRHINIDEYCTFLNMGIQTCIAGLHILQIVAIFVTPYLCTRWGRKLTVI